LGSEGTIYVAGWNPATGFANCIHALRPSDGVILWSFDAGNTIYSGPVVAPDGTIYFGSTDTKVYAVNPTTHQLKPGWPVVTGGWVISSPAIARDGTIYVGSYDGKLYAITPNGTFKWSPLFLGTGNIDSSPAIGPDGSVYIGSWNDKVYSINPNTGQINWAFTTGFDVRSSPAVAADGTICIGSDDGKLYALRPDGTQVGAPWPFSGGGGFSSPVIGADGRVYVGGGNRLYALNGGSGLAHSDWPMYRHNPWHTGNPATLTLASGSRLADLDFQFQIRGLSGMICQVDGSDNLIAWNPLPVPNQPTLITLPAGGVATFTDTGASGYSHRFYRVRSGAILSYNSLGYAAVGVPIGLSMIANQLNNPFGGTVTILLPNPPSGTTLQKWNETTQGFDLNTFSAGAWSIPNMTLNPGEGVLVQPGYATAFTFIGVVLQGALANPFPSGDSIRSSMVPQSDPIDTLLGIPPINNDVIYRYDNVAGSLIGYSYYSDGPSNAWVPEAPAPRVGESFWISTTTARTWTRSFTVW
jgi:outer membrane protein assembly factor BamB